MKSNTLFLGENLPQPLSEEELLYYFEQYQKYNNIRARKIIIEHNIRFVIDRVFQKFSITQYDKEELISDGMIGLIKSVDTFDLSKRNKFLTYATPCIDNEILKFMRKEKRHLKCDSLNKAIKFEIETPVIFKSNNKKMDVIDILQDETFNFTEEYEKKEIYSIISQVVENLEERDKQVIMFYFGFEGEPLNTVEIASKMNLSQSYVSRLIRKNLNQISIKLIEQEVIDKNYHKHETKRKARSKTKKQISN